MKTKIKKYILHIVCTVIMIAGLSSCIATRPVDVIYYDTYPSYIVVPTGTYRPYVRSPYYRPQTVRRSTSTRNNHNNSNNKRTNNQTNNRGRK